jgi:hypothetical protein
MTTIKIEVGSRVYTATLLDNAAVTKLTAMLPLNLKMTELNGNEKYFHLPTKLPTDEIDPGTIKTGDLMLWGANSLVLFYKTFKTSYSYTRLGHIEDPTGLATVLGDDDVTVKFELE